MVLSTTTRIKNAVETFGSEKSNVEGQFRLIWDQKEKIDKKRQLYRIIRPAGIRRKGRDYRKRF